VAYVPDIFVKLDGNGRPVRVPKTYEREVYDAERGAYVAVTVSNYDALDGEALRADGWLPLAEAPRPECEPGCAYRAAYAVVGGEVVQSWERYELPPPTPNAHEFTLGLMGLAPEGAAGADRRDGLDMRRGALAAWEVGALCFVALAQTSDCFGGATLLRFAQLFEEWPETGLECRGGAMRRDAFGLYRALQDIDAENMMMRPSDSPELWGAVGAD